MVCRFVARLFYPCRLSWSRVVQACGMTSCAWSKLVLYNLLVVVNPIPHSTTCDVPCTLQCTSLWPLLVACLISPTRMSPAWNSAVCLSLMRLVAHENLKKKVAWSTPQLLLFRTLQADKLLSFEFTEAIDGLIHHLPPGRQIMLFSATFPVTVKHFKVSASHLALSSLSNFDPLGAS